MDLIRIDVTDLKRFDRELRALESTDFERGLQPTLYAFAAVEAGRIRNRYRETYPQRSGNAVSTITPQATGKGASIQFNSARYPYVAGQEFGSNKYRQFFPWTGPGPAGAGSQGRFVYPQLREDRDELVQGITDRVMEIAGRAFPERLL